MINFHLKLTEFLQSQFNLQEGLALSSSVDVIMLLGLVLVAWLIYFVCYRLVLSVISKIAAKSKNTWDDEFINTGVIKRLARFIPALLLWSLVPLALRTAGLSKAAETLFSVVLIILTVSVVFSILNTFINLYGRREISKEVPLKGVSQTIKILFSIGAGVMVLSVILGKSPAIIFSGFGALTAILMLVFKDSILGLAAGLQLSSNRMIAVGDWIEVPKYGADGNVLELALTTVKVQNWDKTITTVPTYALISDSFKNWRGMSESGLRRIKRSLRIHLDTIRILTTEEVARLSQNPLLSDYLSAKQTELESGTNTEVNPQLTRQLTNVGTYRAYLKAYIDAHELISDEATQLVRQLQPTEKGLPIEIYLFSKDNRWVQFENLQSDLFDHFIAILPEFGLKLHQDPTGHDFAKLGE